MVVVSSQNRTKNRSKKIRAAILLAEDELIDEQIAAEVGISRRQLGTWKTDPDFNALVDGYVGEITAQALKLPIAKKLTRVRELDDLRKSYWQIKDQRGAAYAELLKDTPDNAMMREFGHSVPEWAMTGMLLAQPKIAANGKTVTEWAFDKALDSAIKETHRQAAQELGQWVDKGEVNIGGSLRREYVIVSGDDA